MPTERVLASHWLVTTDGGFRSLRHQSFLFERWWNHLEQARRPSSGPQETAARFCLAGADGATESSAPSGSTDGTWPTKIMGDMALMYTTITSAGVLGPEVQIDNRVCECCKTSMTMTPDGARCRISRSIRQGDPRHFDLALFEREMESAGSLERTMDGRSMAVPSTVRPYRRRERTLPSRGSRRLVRSLR